MPRLHWFWRAAIAYVCCYLLMLLMASMVFDPIDGSIRSFLRSRFGMGSFLSEALPRMLSFGLVLLPAVAATLWLYVRLSPHHANGETRCRKCGYILRGIPEPRCSECGERI